MIGWKASRLSQELLRRQRTAPVKTNKHHRLKWHRDCVRMEKHLETGAIKIIRSVVYPRTGDTCSPFICTSKCLSEPLHWCHVTNGKVLPATRFVVMQNSSKFQCVEESHWRKESAWKRCFPDYRRIHPTNTDNRILCKKKKSLRKLYSLKI